MLHRRRCTEINRLKSNAGPNGQGTGFPRILHSCASGSGARRTALRIISPNPSYLRLQRPHAAHRDSHNLPKSFIVGGAQGFPRRASAPAAAHRTGFWLPQILHSCVRGDDFPRPSCSHNPPKSFIVTPVRQAGRRSSLLISRTYRRSRGGDRFPKSFIVGVAPARPSGPLLQLFSRCSVVSGRRRGEGSRFPQILHSWALSPGRQPDFFRPRISHIWPNGFPYRLQNAREFPRILHNSGPNPSFYPPNPS
jgi:hypothetical protein